MAKYAACSSEVNAELKLKRLAEIRAGRDIDVGEILWERLRDCKDKADIHESINIRNALKKCAESRNSLDKGESMNGLTCSLVLYLHSNPPGI